MFDAEPQAMLYKRFPGALVVLGLLILAALTAGCGGSGAVSIRPSRLF